MYEVEVMLGETDETHIIRTIEYWDNEKRKWPQRQHFAVLVAEHINRRFFNVIHLLSHSIPIIAVQVSMLIANGKKSISFTKVLDTYEEVDDGTVTAGIAVPGYVGYEPGAPLPTLEQILDGTTPANSPPVRVLHVPGSRYAYSGGGYEIVQALIEGKTPRSFGRALKDLVFRPARMGDSTFTQPPPTSLVDRIARGHYADGRELPGGWRVMPELAAGGLWSTPTDLAKLLIEIARAYRGESRRFMSQKTAKDMLTPQNGGPYGLGGAVAGSGRSLVLMKRGQNIGYQSYMLIFPNTGQGIVVMSGSDNGTTLATALIRRAAKLYNWPPLGELAD